MGDGKSCLGKSSEISQFGDQKEEYVRCMPEGMASAEAETWKSYVCLEKVLCVLILVCGASGARWQRCDCQDRGLRSLDFYLLDAKELSEFFNQGSNMVNFLSLFTKS